MATIEEKYEDLNRKYTLLLEDNRKVHETLKKVNETPFLTANSDFEDLLYFVKIRSIVYLNNSTPKNCLVCGEAKPTTAHHIIPRRANCKNKILRNLRIRVCEDCEKLVHPENKVFKQKVIAEQNQVIGKLKQLLQEKKNE